jgi:glycosyltransferase involved in cell wall biosynthesis
VLILAAVMTRSLGRAKLVLDYHDLMPELYCAKYRLKQDSTQVRLLKWVEQVSATLADAVLTACDTFKENLVLRGVPRSRVYVIRNLPDSRLFQPDRDAIVRCDPIFTLLYLGTLSERYGVDLAIRALAILRLRIPRIKLRIIGKISGEGDYKSTLQELATKCGVEDLVEFLQPVPLDEVSAEIAACDVGVYTPVRDVHMDNAFSLKAGEFAAMRVPMVTTRTPVMESHLGPSGAAYIDAGDIQGFVAQVVRLHSDSGFYGDLVRASEEFTRLHNWDAERQLYLNVVNGLIQTRFR